MRAFALTRATPPPLSLQMGDRAVNLEQCSTKQSNNHHIRNLKNVLGSKEVEFYQHLKHNIEKKSNVRNLF